MKFLPRLNRQQRRRRPRPVVAAIESLEERTLLSSTPAALVTATHEFSNDVDVTISSRSRSTITSTIEVAGLEGTIADLNVQLNLSHSFDRDLILTLIAPNGERVRLANRLGGSGDDYRDTVFDDEVDQSIQHGRAPFRGIFRPQGDLSAVDGLDPNGVWTLEVQDVTRRRGGQLHDWSIVLTTQTTDTGDDTSDEGGDESDDDHSDEGDDSENGDDTDETDDEDPQEPTLVETTRTFENLNDITISSRSTSTIQSTIDVFGLNGTLSDINVTVDIDHQSDRDLRIFLIGPQGERVKLAAGLGGTRDDYDHTTFDDDASRSIIHGSAPFRGTFRPQESLSSFHGSDPNGEWTLQIQDTNRRRGGALRSWALEVTAVEEQGTAPQGTTGSVEFAAPAYRVGDVLTIDVNDIDLVAETEIPVDVLIAGDSETVVLAALGSGRFRGQIATTAATGTAHDNLLNVATMTPISVRYVDQFDADGTTSTLTDTTHLTPHTSRLEFDQTDYVAGEPIQVTLTDRDLTGLEQIPVSLVVDGDREAVVLQAVGQGVFRGTLTTIDSAGTENDGSLNILADGVVTASFTDTHNLFGSEQLIQTSAALELPPPPTGSTGTVAWSRTTYRVGDIVRVTVNDADLLQTDVLAVLVTSGDDNETIELTAQGDGTFIGQIATSAAAGGDQNGVLNVVAGSTFTASYVDTFDSAGNSTTVSQTARFLSHTATLTLNGSTYSAGDPVTLTLHDPDLTGRAAVQATVISGADQELVTLLAIGNGQFRGTVNTTAANGLDFDGTLNVDPGGTILARYTDPHDVFGFSRLIQDSAQVRNLEEPASEFDIVVRFTDNNMTASQQAAFADAAARWSEIIVGDLPDVFTSVGLVDDVVIDASAPYIDGPFNILGQAGPREVRSRSLLPAYGIMRFDSADLSIMEANGTLTDVILHEMGHVLGLGTLWSFMNLASGLGGSNPVYTGAAGRAAYGELLGTGPTDVPLENSGGSGTRDGHWRESVFDHELMTGYAESGAMPISQLTVAALADMGYEVNFAAADAYSLPGTSSTAANTTGTTSGTGLFAESDHEHEHDHDHEGDHNHEHDHEHGHDHEHLDPGEIVILSPLAEVEVQQAVMSWLAGMDLQFGRDKLDWTTHFQFG